MNKRQKIVQGRFLDNEEAVITMLEDTYEKALKDVTAKSQKLYDEIETLTAELDFIEDEAEREVQKSKIRSKVYQKQYQDGLKKQTGDILDKMHKENFKNVSDYLQTCYDDGFVGTLYDLQGQGIPFAFPIDQEAVTRAVQIDSKISNGLYSHLGEDVAKLKKHIASEVSRGIVAGMSFNQIAQQLKFKMTGTYNNVGGSLAYAKRIARTEGHRIQCQAGMDACYKAKDMGADVVKQWDSTLDAKTRESHAQVDGEIKEVDEKFSNGLMFPGDPSGGAAEVVNCRCALLERARWAVKGGNTKMNNFTKQLESFESPEEYDEFKKAFFSKENRNYMNYTDQMQGKYGTKDFETLVSEMTDKDYDKFSLLTEKNPIINKKALEKTSQSDKIRLGVIRDAVASGKVSLQIKSRQTLHIKGNPNFREGRSYFEAGTDVQKLLDELKGTGSPIFDSNGEWTNKERVVCPDPVGIHVDGATGKETPTRNLTIIYSKDGCHLVPGRSDGQ